jgi:hypothetical protein
LQPCLHRSRRQLSKKSLHRVIAPAALARRRTIPRKAPEVRLLQCRSRLLRCQRLL